MNKKIIAILLIFVMIVGNSVVVFGADKVTGTFTGEGSWSYEQAPDSDGSTTTNSKDVKANVDITAGDTYSAEITWGALTYTATANGTWNTTNANYDISGSTTWNSTRTGTDDMVKVTNKSNVYIKATISGLVDSDFKTNYAPSSGYGFNICSQGVGNDFIFALPGANPKFVHNANVKVEISANITKAPQKSISNLTVGKITVTLDKYTG